MFRRAFVLIVQLTQKPRKDNEKIIAGIREIAFRRKQETGDCFATQ